MRANSNNMATWEQRSERTTRNRKLIALCLICNCDSKQENRSYQTFHDSSGRVRPTDLVKRVETELGSKAVTWHATLCCAVCQRRLKRVEGGKRDILEFHMKYQQTRQQQQALSGKPTDLKTEDLIRLVKELLPILQSPVTGDSMAFRVLTRLTELLEVSVKHFIQGSNLARIVVNSGTSEEEKSVDDLLKTIWQIDPKLGQVRSGSAPKQGQVRSTSAAKPDQDRSASAPKLVPAGSAFAPKPGQVASASGPTQGQTGKTGSASAPLQSTRKVCEGSEGNVKSSATDSMVDDAQPQHPQLTKCHEIADTDTDVQSTDYHDTVINLLGTDCQDKNVHEMNEKPNNLVDLDLPIYHIEDNEINKKDKTGHDIETTDTASHTCTMLDDSDCNADLHGGLILSVEEIKMESDDFDQSIVDPSTQDCDWLNSIPVTAENTFSSSKSCVENTAGICSNNKNSVPCDVSTLPDNTSNMELFTLVQNNPVVLRRIETAPRLGRDTSVHHPDNTRDTPVCQSDTTCRKDTPVYQSDTTCDQPGTTRDQPGTTRDQPGTTRDQPGTTRDQPGTTRDQPGTTGDQPGTTCDQPSTTHDHPGTTRDQSGTTCDKPCTTCDLPGTTYDQPGTTCDTPGSICDHPGTTCDHPGTTCDQPGTSCDKPGSVWDQPDTTCDQTSTTCDQRSTTCDRPGTTCDHPGTTCDQPGTICDQPGTTLDQPGTTLDQPGTTCDQPGTTCDQPSTTCDQQANIATEILLSSENEDESEILSDLKTNLTYLEYHCFLCGPPTKSNIPFESQTHLDNHMYTEHVVGIKNQDNLECPVCNKLSQKVISESSVKYSCSQQLLHLVSRHKWEVPNYIITQKCRYPNCQFIALTKPQMKRHRHNSVLCELCKGYHKYGRLKEHLRKCPGNLDKKAVEKEQCPVCKKQVKKQYLKLHTESHEQIICHVCSKLMGRYEMKWHLFRRHGINSNNRRTLHCASCDYQTILGRDLRDHTKRYHEKRLVPCPTCHKMLSEMSLDVHIRQVHCERKFSCSQCAYKAKTRRGLSLHMVRHSGVRDHACDWCPYKGATKGCLRKHQQTCRDHPKNKT